MRTTHVRFVWILVALFAFGVQATAQQKKLKKELKKLMSSFDAVGLSVAVVKDNKIIYTQAMGLKDIGKKEKLREKDIFRIASISKSFTSTALMQLIEAGKVSLEDDVSKLVGFTVRNPMFPEQPITLRMILSHTSSLNDGEGYFTLDVIHPDKNTNYKKCYSNNQPGSTYAYCNLNFNMAGTILERLSGERFDQYIVNHILRPLNVYGGYCIDSLNAALFATLYEYDSVKQQFMPAENAYNPRRDEISKYVQGYSTPVFSPTGGMKISARDLATYMMMHMNFGALGDVRIIQSEHARQMQTPVLQSSGYGLALHVSENYIPGKRMVGHTGSAYGLFSNMFFNPDEKFGLVLITNGCKVSYKDGWNDFLHQAALLLYHRLIEGR